MAGKSSTKLTIELPEDVLLALHRRPEDFEKEARLLLALKLYEDDRLTSGLAAKLAGLPRSAFIALMGQYGLSPIDHDAGALERDLKDARAARRPQ